jgi:transposase
VGNAISNDLRQRIVDRDLSKNEFYDSVAAHFQVGRATVNRVVNRFRRTGAVDPAPHGGGHPPRIKEEELPRLRDLVAEMRRILRPSGAGVLVPQ